MDASDKQHLKQVIELAGQGIASGHGPFAARIVLNGETLAEAHNSVTQQHDPTAHAEILVIRLACQQLGQHHLEGATLYASCEPCPMCLAAAHWAHIKRIIYAASSQDARAAGFDDQHIAEELCTTSLLRDLPMEQGLRGEGVWVFDEWVGYPDKQKY